MSQRERRLWCDARLSVWLFGALVQTAITATAFGGAPLDQTVALFFLAVLVAGLAAIVRETMAWMSGP